MLLTVPQVCEETGLSRTAVYDLLRSERLPSVKLGRRRLIRSSDLIEWEGALVPAPVGGHRD